MKLKIYIAVFLLVAALATTNFFLFKAVKNQSNHIDNLQLNQSQLLGDSLNARLELNKKEFRKLLETELDSVSKLVKGLKPKHITNITKVQNNYIDSSKTINQAPQLTDSTFDISITGDPCWGFEGEFNLSSKSTTIFKKWSKDEIIKYTYFKRQRLFEWKWTPRWGKKRYFIGSKSKCDGEVKVQEFELNKKDK